MFLDNRVSDTLASNFLLREEDDVVSVRNAY